MKLPYKLDAEEFFSNYKTLQEWADANEELFSKLLLEGIEVLAYTTSRDVTILTVEGLGIMVVDMEIDSALFIAETNERHWVELEDYHLAVRARDAGEYIKKRLQNAHTSH